MGNIRKRVYDLHVNFRNILKTMKTLEQKIILALHPECKTWEEACNKELKVVEITNGDLCFINNFWQSYNHLNHHYEQLDDYEKEDYILPISLPRVMQAISNITSEDGRIQKGFINDGDFVFQKTDSVYEFIGYWKLTDKNAKDLNLEDQSEETREALNKLFK